jgi:hypothetical protein
MRALLSIGATILAACSVFADFDSPVSTVAPDAAVPGLVQDAGGQLPDVSSTNDASPTASPCGKSPQAGQLFCEDFENWGATSGNWNTLIGGGTRSYTIAGPDGAKFFEMLTLTPPATYPDGGREAFNYLGLKRAIAGARRGIDLYADVWIGPDSELLGSEILVMQQNSVAFYLAPGKLTTSDDVTSYPTFPVAQWFRLHLSLSLGVGNSCRIVIESNGKLVKDLSQTLAWGPDGILGFTLGPEHIPYEFTKEHYRFDNVVVLAK